ncbi:pyruvate kinase [Candidatus Parcubacteria bacterium]|nr:MAG: pyruvate kinase [Candidatus Parcubacteria bacterium]
MRQRRTKIVATIGPASAKVSTLVKMARAGMDIARLNFSHGDHDSHKELITNIRLAAQKSGKPIAILQDLQGPKIRLGVLPEKGVKIYKGQLFELRTGKLDYKNEGALPVTYDNLHKDVKKGEHIVLADGLITGRIEKVRGRSIYIKVLYDGVLFSHQSLIFPDSNIKLESFTEKDREDLLFGLKSEVDWIALSFVNGAEVIKKVKRTISRIVAGHNLYKNAPRIIAKIERRAALENFDEILEAADAIMVARGDLGVSVPLEEVPIIQKEIIEKCRLAGKPVIVATQMLESMINNPQATRAEISDVANAVIDHADAVMLSAETATGEYPYLSVQTMSAVIEETEQSRFDDIVFYKIHEKLSVIAHLSRSLHMMAEDEQIQAIVVGADNLDILGAVTMFRPTVPIIVACKNNFEKRRVILYAGAQGVIIQPGSSATFVHRMEQKLKKHKIFSKTGKAAYILASPRNQEIKLMIR